MCIRDRNIPALFTDPACGHVLRAKGFVQDENCLLYTSLLIYNILYVSVVKDVQFYGRLKTIGTTQRQIKRIIYKQAIRISCIGIPIGLLLGAVVSFGIVPYFLNMMYSTNSDVDVYKRQM